MSAHFVLVGLELTNGAAQVLEVVIGCHKALWDGSDGVLRAWFRVLDGAGTECVVFLAADRMAIDTFVSD